MSKLQQQFAEILQEKRDLVGFLFINLKWSNLTTLKNK